ncbi:hypothetical protein HDU82_005487 [Entophlyctis luteolus]|nr:hypothetical protein HDU82_005487 [Entophlyctis luteolus]
MTLSICDDWEASTTLSSIIQVVDGDSCMREIGSSNGCDPVVFVQKGECSDPLTLRVILEKNKAASAVRIVSNSRIQELYVGSDADYVGTTDISERLEGGLWATSFVFGSHGTSVSSICIKLLSLPKDSKARAIIQNILVITDDIVAMGTERKGEPSFNVLEEVSDLMKSLTLELQEPKRYTNHEIDEKFIQLENKLSNLIELRFGELRDLIGEKCSCKGE